MGNKTMAFLRRQNRLWLQKQQPLKGGHKKQGCWTGPIVRSPDLTGALSKHHFLLAIHMVAQTKLDWAPSPPTIRAGVIDRALPCGPSSWKAHPGGREAVVTLGALGDTRRCFSF